MSLITHGGEGTVGAVTIEIREVGSGGGVVVVSRDSEVAVLTAETFPPTFLVRDDASSAELLLYASTRCGEQASTL